MNARLQLIQMGHDHGGYPINTKLYLSQNLSVLQYDKSVNKHPVSNFFRTPFGSQIFDLPSGKHLHDC